MMMALDGKITKLLTVHPEGNVTVHPHVHLLKRSKTNVQLLTRCEFLTFRTTVATVGEFCSKILN